MEDKLLEEEKEDDDGVVSVYDVIILVSVLFHCRHV